ncbi:hypothetical protein O0L34_g12988 [Tuta absoluta]|nr:hypothetical protein O0L34_g12988 [Tuta absoluta]
MRVLIAIALLVTTATPFVASQTNWADKAKFENFVTYYPKLLQEMIYGVEKIGWCNFKLFDQTLSINETIYDHEYIGTVNFTDGFLVSIQHLNLENVQQAFMRALTSYTNSGTMLATLKLNNALVGYNVDADFGDLGKHRMTATYMHKDIQYQIRVVQNLNTSDITTSVRHISLNGNTHMEMLPNTRIGQVISRHFKAYTNQDAVESWGETMNSLLREAIDRIGFPKVCFNC